MQSNYWYRQGSVSITAGSNVVTGVNTYWMSGIVPPSPGDAFSLDGKDWREIIEITTNGSLKVVGNFTSAATGVSYVIKPVVSAAPALRAQQQVSQLVQLYSTFFLQLNKFWYEPGEVVLQDPFGVEHRHQTLYSLNAGIAERTLELDTMVEQARQSTNMFNTLQQNVNTLSATVAGLQANVDSKLLSANQSATDALQSRNEALDYRNAGQAAASAAAADALTATQKASAASASQVDVTTKHGQINTWHTTINSRHTDISAWHTTITSRHTDISGWHTTVNSHHTTINGWYTDINNWRNTVATQHGEIATWRGEVNTAKLDAQAAVLLARRWASAPDDEVVADGLKSARFYMTKAAEFAQQTAANVSGGVSLRGFHNPSGGFPVGADVGYMYKLSASGILTFESEGSKAVSTGDYIIKTATGWIHLDDATDAVKTSRTINGYTLNANITLTVADIAGAVATTDVRLTNSREWTGLTISQSEAEAGTNTTRRAFTAQRVAQAIAAQAAPKAATDSRLTAVEQQAATLATQAEALTQRVNNIESSSSRRERLKRLLGEDIFN